jgi:hypothetical protein
MIANKYRWVPLCWITLNARYIDMVRVNWKTDIRNFSYVEGNVMQPYLSESTHQHVLVA